MQYKDLIVWQKSHSLSLKTLLALKSIQSSYEVEILSRQLIRAVTSIGANIAEGYGRYEGKEYSRFLRIAYGSASETDNWINLLRDSGSMPPDIAAGLIKDNEEILKILAAIIKKLKAKSE